MARKQSPAAAKTYTAAERFVEQCLRSGDSLFTPGRAIWSAEVAHELRQRIVDADDESGEPYMQRFERQLRGASAEAHQLLAELFFVYFLPVDHIGGVAKRKTLNEVLGLGPADVEVPAPLAAALDGGLYHPGPSYNAHRPRFVEQLALFADEWCALPEVERAKLLSNPLGFKEFVFRHEVQSAAAQRHAMLHLVMPEAFEPVVTLKHKQRIAAAFAEHVEDETADLDIQLQQLRAALEEEYDGPLDYYLPPLKDLWDSPSAASVRSRSGRTTPPPEEVLARLLPDSSSREAILEVLARGVERAHARNPDSWSVTLRRRKVRLNVGNLRAFDIERERVVLAVIADRLDPEALRDPAVELSDEPFKVLPGAHDVAVPAEDFERIWPRIADAHRALLDRAADRSKAPWSRAHSHAFLAHLSSCVGRELPDLPQPEPEAEAPVPKVEPKEHPPMGDLEERLFLEPGALDRITELLDDKLQVVFHGPPGTGKTFIAQELAARLAGSRERVELVQFHPGYAYEDFVEGFRPTLAGSQAGFELRHGPLKRIAEAARAQPGETFVLIIDELNRGNVAKVFGELYFLLEYRDRSIQLQYSQEPFSLPRNLLFIGTMNTSDRSIALVDLALRRRFHFAPFFPDARPIKGVLRRWLSARTEGLDWLADVVDRANELIGDRHVAIGPSHFMKADVDEAWVEMVWQHSVLPYIEEQLFGQGERFDQFDLKRLRKAVAGRRAEAEGDARRERQLGPEDLDLEPVG